MDFWTSILSGSGGTIILAAIVGLIVWTIKKNMTKSDKKEEKKEQKIEELEKTKYDLLISEIEDLKKNKESRNKVDTTPYELVTKITCDKMTTQFRKDINELYELDRARSKDIQEMTKENHSILLEISKDISYLKGKAESKDKNI